MHIAGVHDVTYPSADVEFLDPGQPVDLSNCDREPIHIPGSIQPRGVLLALSEPDLRVIQVSENANELLDTQVEFIGATLTEAIGARAATVISRHVETFRELRDRNPVSVWVETGGGHQLMDALLHRVLADDGARAVLIVELEEAQGARPFSFPNTYQAVRGAVTELNRAASLEELYRMAAHQVRDLTGFDRVMIYRFDAAYNGEVVAEAKLDGLNSFLGLHYPSTDIPVQARKLYESNWIRLISDVSYTPSLIRPAVNPVTRSPLDLTHAALRSVSPIHIEYLHNMGVRASMSISLLRDDKLWGLIACHHYAGPHAPPYAVRAAAEFLGSALSLRLVDRSAQQDQQAALVSRSTLAGLVAAMQDENVALGAAMLGAQGLLDLVPADGVIVYTEGRFASAGVVPADAAVDALLVLVLNHPGDIIVADALGEEFPGADLVDDGVAGLLALRLPEDQLVIWLRREVPREVSWGGDPTSKVMAQGEDAMVRLSPRLSFERWSEIVRGHSEPWLAEQVGSATGLRTHLLEALYHRGRRRMASAETVQRSLLPDKLPKTSGWELDARYQPSIGGQVGGDWYDAFVLPDGRLAVVVGDVAGHGLEAAGTMAQLRNGLRAYLFLGHGPAAAVQALDRLVDWLLSGQMATLVVAVVDTVEGLVELVSAGHLRPFLIDPDGSVTELAIESGIPLGVEPNDVPTNTFALPAGAGLVLFTDGIVERRTESIEIGLLRLRQLFAGGDALHKIDAAMNSRDPESSDDATVLILRRQ